MASLFIFPEKFLFPRFWAKLSDVEHGPLGPLQCVSQSMKDLSNRSKNFSETLGK